MAKTKIHPENMQECRGLLGLRDFKDLKVKLENLVMTYDPHAFLVVLAVDDTSSLATVSTDLSDDGLFSLFQAEGLLAGLVSSSSLAGRATILVANKTDLVRLSISSILS